MLILWETRVQTSIDVTMGFNNSERVTTATNKIRINYVKMLVVL